MTLDQAITIHGTLSRWLDDIETVQVLRDEGGWERLAIRMSGVWTWLGTKHRIVVEGWDETNVVCEANFAKLAILGVVEPVKPAADLDLDELDGLDLLLD